MSQRPSDFEDLQELSADPEAQKRRRTQLDRQIAQLVECEFHSGVRFLKSREKGCPKCEALFDSGHRPDGKFRPGVSGNPGGNPKGYHEFASLLKRYSAARDPRTGRSKQESIARMIVERAEKGQEPFLSYYMSRLAGVTSKSEIELTDQRAPGELPLIPSDEARDAKVALILAALHEQPESAEGLLESLSTEGPEQ